MPPGLTEETLSYGILALGTSSHINATATAGGC